MIKGHEDWNHFFIAFEGGEGSGKSTQAKILAKYLREKNKDVLLTREPGGPSTAEAVRTLMMDKSHKWDTLSEVFLHLAARRENVQKVIVPHLKKGGWVISDRFSCSTFAYQGNMKGADMKKIRQLNGMAVESLKPNLTFLLDIPVDIGLARARKASQKASNRAGHEAGHKKTADRYESLPEDFHQKVRADFLSMAKKSLFSPWIVVDGTASKKKIAAIVEQQMVAFFSLYFPNKSS